MIRTPRDLDQAVTRRGSRVELGGRFPESIFCSCLCKSCGGNPLGGLQRLQSPQIMGGGVTKIIPDKACTVIAPGHVVF